MGVMLAAVGACSETAAGNEQEASTMASTSS